MKLHTLSLTLVLTLSLVGCAPGGAPKAAPAPPAKATPPAPTPAPVAAAKAEAPKPVPAPSPKPKPKAPVKYVVTGENLLFNPSFENWNEDGSVAAWNLAEGLDATWTPVKGARVGVDVPVGKNAIELPSPAAGNTVVLSQTILPGKVQPSQRLWISAMAKANAQESLHLLLTYTAGGKEQQVRRIHSGGGAWENLVDKFWVPADADTASFRVQVIVKNADASPVQLDDIRVLHMKAVPADAPAAAGQSGDDAAAVAPLPAPKPMPALPSAKAVDDKADSKKSKK